MSWVWERTKSTSHWNVWKRKFLTVKGSELQIFEMPPVSMFIIVKVVSEEDFYSVKFK